MTEKISRKYGNILVDFDQAVSILENLGHSVEIITKTEYGRYNDVEDRYQLYVVKKNGNYLCCESNTLTPKNKDGVYCGRVFNICFEILDNQMKDQILKAALSQLDVDIF